VTLVIPADVEGRFVASCGECEWTREFPTELIATRRGEEHHHSHSRWAKILDLLQAINAKKRALPAAEHVHTVHCTTDICSGGLWFCGERCRVYRLGHEAGEPCIGHVIPSRAELVAAARKRRGLDV